MNFVYPLSAHRHSERSGSSAVGSVRQLACAPSISTARAAPTANGSFWLAPRPAPEASAGRRYLALLTVARCGAPISAVFGLGTAR